MPAFFSGRVCTSEVLHHRRLRISTRKSGISRSREGAGAWGRRVHRVIKGPKFVEASRGIVAADVKKGWSGEGGRQTERNLDIRSAID